VHFLIASFDLDVESVFSVRVEYYYVAVLGKRSIDTEGGITILIKAATLDSDAGPVLAVVSDRSTFRIGNLELALSG